LSLHGIVICASLAGGLITAKVSGMLGGAAAGGEVVEAAHLARARSRIVA
jgi:hypothetical protein